VIERVLVGSDTDLIGPTFVGADEEAASPDEDPTVTVVSRVTHDTLTAPTVTGTGDPAVYTARLTAADHTATLDVLDVTWTAVVGGMTRTHAQEVWIVGGVYETIPGLREITTLANASTRPAAQLRKFRNEIESIIEEARGTAYVRRATVETFTIGRHPIRLRWRHCTPLAVWVDGVAQDETLYDVDPITATVTTDAGWFPAGTVVEIAYAHGHQAPPTLAVEAAREYVRAKCLTDSSSQMRGVSSVTSLATQEVYRFTTVDPKYGRFTGIEEVDSRILNLTDERVAIR